MAYLALYRKYRPGNFDEVVGQDDVVRILKNQILCDRIGHAYLFTGIRGTGKTSIAKIFARAVNCQSNADGNPCNQCEVCKNIDQPSVMDIIEIDAASNRGVDEIRDIREKVIYPPKIGRYKVYIIDEVHMLTKEAFNALLKTLEEPPSHIIFILATTEVNKLPATILSRCQRFDIRPISQGKIAEQIRHILEDNQVMMEEEAIQLIAARGDHSMRDALSILDQAIDIRNGDEIITGEAVMRFLGMTARAVLLKLITAVLNNDAVQVIQLLNHLKQKGTDNHLLAGQIIEVLRQMIIVKTVGQKAENILETGKSEITSLEAAGKGIDRRRLFKIIGDLIEDRQKMRCHDCSDIILEMALLKQCETDAFQDSVQIPEKAAVWQKGTIKTEPIPKQAIQQKKQNETVIVPEPEEMPKAAVVVNDKIETKSSESDLQVSDEKIPAEVQSDQEEPQKPKDDMNQTALLCQAIENWNRSQDFFTGQIVSFGNLKYLAPGQYAMIFYAPEHNMYAEMFSGRIQHQVEEVMTEALGEKVHLSVECISKKYDEMDAAEKTAAIVGDQFKSKIKVTD